MPFSQAGNCHFPIDNIHHANRNGFLYNVRNLSSNLMFNYISLFSLTSHPLYLPTYELGTLSDRGVMDEPPGLLEQAVKDGMDHSRKCKW